MLGEAIGDLLPSAVGVVVLRPESGLFFANAEAVRRPARSTPGAQ